MNNFCLICKKSIEKILYIRVYATFVLPIYAEWTFLPLFFGQVHFPYKGVWFYCYHFFFVEISERIANNVDPGSTLLANVPFMGR